MSSKDNSNSNVSTTSLQSTTTANSTSPLKGTQTAPLKDYSAALATLQSRYGTGGHLPTPKAGIVKSEAKPSVAASQSDSTLTSTTASSSLVSESLNSTSAGGSGDVKKKGFILALKNKFKS